MVHTFEYRSTMQPVDEALQNIKHLTLGDCTMVEDRLVNLLGGPNLEARFKE